jgi:hypothetical protein
MLALDWGECWDSHPGNLTPGGNSPWSPLERRLGGPQSRSVRCAVEKSSCPYRESDPDSPARRYTDWANVIHIRIFILSTVYTWIKYWNVHIFIVLYRSILLHCVHLWYIHLLPPCSSATIYRRYLKFNYKYNMNFKTSKLYYKLCRTHYMFRPIWPSSGVKSYVKIALKTAALLHLRFPASGFLKYSSLVC